MSDKRPLEQDGRAPRPVGRAAVKTALDWIDRQVVRLGADVAPLIGAAGRVLAEPVTAAADVPPTDRAANDGIALRAEDTVGASTYNPLSFRRMLPGEMLPPFGAARVRAGDPLPAGADAVVPLERASPDAAGGYEIIEPMAAGGEVERAGSHAARGATLLVAGRQIRPYDIGLLAAGGVLEVPVIRRPEVRVVTVSRVTTGILDTNSVLLRALIQRDGGQVPDFRRVDHDCKTLRDEFTAPGSDVILVVGGDAEDVAATAIMGGGALAIRGIAVFPGEATSIGRVGGRVPVFLLADAPAACLWAYELFAGRAIRRLGGRDPMLPHRRKQMVTTRKIVSGIGVTEICPVRCRGGRVEPIASFAEAGIMAAARADGFVIVPEGSEGFPEGATVTVYLQEECERSAFEGSSTP